MKAISLTEAKKKRKRVSRATASAVYHRDYVKTKNRPYRKYHREVDEGALNEGPMDFLRGAAGEVGRKVSSVASDVSTAGRTSSAMGDAKRLVSRLLNALSTYDQLKTLSHASAPVQQTAQQTAQPPQQQSNMGQPNPEQQPAARTPRPTREKPRMRPGPYGHEYVFSSEFAMMATTDLLNEGAWDYAKAAGGAFIQHYHDKLRQKYLKMPEVLSKMNAAGQAASLRSDRNKQTNELNAVKMQIVKLVMGLVDVSNRISKLGQNGDEEITEIADRLSNGSGPRVAKLMQRARQMKQQTAPQQRPEPSL